MNDLYPAGPRNSLLGGRFALSSLLGEWDMFDWNETDSTENRGSLGEGEVAVFLGGLKPFNNKFF